MYSQEDITFIKERIFSLVNFDYRGEIIVKEADCLSLEADENHAVISCSKKSELARGFFLLAKEMSAGNKKISIQQKAHFKDLGVMLDFSRGSIYNPEAVKKFLTYMAALGMNTLLLYLEDTYELKEYPYFGHMRGRYTKEEIRDIDSYAVKLGVELIPCVQTLAHLKTYLKWKEADKVRDSDQVLLVGEEETYKLIQTMIKTLSDMFSSRRIHLGMDEAHSMGQGNYAKKHRIVDKKKMFIEHLNRVKAMCVEEGLSPMIWSDMIFRLCGGEGGVNEEYDPQSVITEDIAQAISGLNLSYWDYYRTEQSEYDSVISRHQKFDAEISFAGAVWTWDGYLPNFKYTFDTTYPAMRACLDRGVKEVYATLWGCDGTDTDYMHAVPGLAAFSEYCYLGKECSENDVYEAAEYLTGTNREILDAVSEFFLGYKGAVSLGERFVDADLLFEILRYRIDYEKTAETYKKALAVLKKYPENELAAHAALLFEIAMEKSMIFKNLRPAYQCGDKETLKRILEKLPELINVYDRFFESYEDIMEKNRKPFGTEIIHIRFAGVKKRLEYAYKKLASYLADEVDSIPELEETALNNETVSWRLAEAFMKTM